MIHDWFRTLEFPCDWARFAALPRHPAYRYEYRGGRATMTPQPRFHHALLSLVECRFLQRPLHPLADHPSTAPANRLAGYLRRLQPADWELLPALMARAFADSAPLAHLSTAERLQAADSLLQRTRSGEDGPLAENACFLLAQPGENEPEGAILVTLIPDGDLDTFNSAAWTEAPPSQAAQRRWGRPHLTWIFTSPHRRRRGYAETLLTASLRELDSMHYSHLASTFLLGDAASLAWHWRMGFRLLSHPGSPRRIKAE